jgi:hypothetical protein
MYQMKKYTSPGLIPHRSQTSSSNQQDRSSLYSGTLSGDGGVTSADPKPRLRWTPELHERFVDAVMQLGGSDSMFSFILSAFFVFPYHVPFALKCQALCHFAMRAFPPVLIMCPWKEILDEVHQSYPEDSPKDYCDPGRKSGMRCSSDIQWSHWKTTLTWKNAHKNLINTVKSYLFIVPCF